MSDVTWLLGRGVRAEPQSRNLHQREGKKRGVNDSRGHPEALKQPRDNTKNLIIRGKTEPEC